MNSSTKVVQTGFDIDSFFMQCDELSKKAASQGGSVEVIYQRNLSRRIHRLIALLPAEQHSAARHVAAMAYDYLTPAEIAQEIQDDLDAGYCVHGYGPDFCPLGCGDLDGGAIVDDIEGVTPWSWIDAMNEEDFYDLRDEVLADIRKIGAKYEVLISTQLAGLKG